MTICGVYNRFNALPCANVAIHLCKKKHISHIYTSFLCSFMVNAIFLLAVDMIIDLASCPFTYSLHIHCNLTINVAETRNRHTHTYTHGREYLCMWIVVFHNFRFGCDVMHFWLLICCCCCWSVFGACRFWMRCACGRNCTKCINMWPQNKKLRLRTEVCIMNSN